MHELEILEDLNGILKALLRGHLWGNGFRVGTLFSSVPVCGDSSPIAKIYRSNESRGKVALVFLILIL